MLFTRWGAFVYRFRKVISILTLILAVGALVLSSQTAGALSAGGWTDPDSESVVVSDRLADEFAAGRGSIVAVFRGETGADARSPEFQAMVAGSLAGLAEDDRVNALIGWEQTRDDRFISTDGASAYVLVDLAITDEEAVDLMPELRALIVQPSGAELLLTGVAPATEDQTVQAEKELILAESVSFPFAALILILVFSSIVAAGMPLIVAALAIPTALAGVYVAAQVTDLSIYVQNVATMLGLALAIDYSLFMVSRFREELRKGRDVGTAVEITVATSGKAVAFSGLAVAVGLSGLLLFEPTALRSFGIGGSIVVAASVFYALTFLPAVLGMLGHRVNSLGVAAIRDRIRRAFGRPTGVAADIATETRWERMAHWVMARPVAVLIPTLAFLLLLGTPFLRLEQGIPDASILPARHREPRGCRRPRRGLSGGRDLADRRPGHRRRLADGRRQRPEAPGLCRRPRGARWRRQGRGSVRRPQGPGDRGRARRGGHRGALRRPARPAAAGDGGRPRGARGCLHPRLDRAPRRDQPVRAAEPGRHRCRTRGSRRPGRAASPQTWADSPPRAPTSWPASPRRSPTRSPGPSARAP